MVYLERSGYDPKALLEYLEKIQNMPVTVDSKTMGTHPGTSDRIARLEEINYSVSIESSIIEKRKERFDVALK